MTKIFYLPRKTGPDDFELVPYEADTSLCTICYVPGIAATAACKGAVLDFKDSLEKPEQLLSSDFVLCATCTGFAREGRMDDLIDARIRALPDGHEDLKETTRTGDARRADLRSEFGLFLESLRGRELHDVDDPDYRFNYRSGLAPGSLPAGGTDSWGRDRDCHAWLETHKATEPASYETFKETFRHTYAFAIPNIEALETIKRYSPNGVVEIGAGNGYWAHLLGQIGVDVRAIDKNLIPLGRNPYWRAGRPPEQMKLWAPMTAGDASDVARVEPERTLLMVWPPMGDSLGEEALRNFKGDTVCYVGDWRNSTGDKIMHNMLRLLWQYVEAVRIPTFFGFQDQLVVFTRRPQNEVEAIVRDMAAKRGMTITEPPAA